MKSFYLFTLVLVTLALAYWPSVTMANVFCNGSLTIPIDQLRADALMAIKSWRKSNHTGQSAKLEGNVTSWECTTTNNTLSLKGCKDLSVYLWSAVEQFVIPQTRTDDNTASNQCSADWWNATVGWIPKQI